MGHKDKLPLWTQGKEGGIVHQFRTRLADGSFLLIPQLCLFISDQTRLIIVLFLQI